MPQASNHPPGQTSGCPLHMSAKGQSRSSTGTSLLLQATMTTQVKVTISIVWVPDHDGIEGNKDQTRELRK